MELRKTVLLILLTSLIFSCDKSPMEPESFPLLENVIKISSGRAYNLALKSDGTVWAWGYNGFGNLGIKPDSMIQSTVAIKIKTLENIIDIEAGYNHCFALSSDGTLYSWGANYFGQLGTGEKFPYTHIPQEVNTSKNVKSIAAGHDFSIALMNDGSVYSWGRNYKGSLGIGSYEEKISPTKIELLGNIKKIAAWLWSCIALDDQGHVWTWGDNTFQQLGRQSQPLFDADPNPGKVENLPLVIEIASGSRTYAIAQSNQVIQFGYDNSLINSLHSVSKVACSEDHQLALKLNSKIVSWGKNEYGQLGIGSNESIYLSESEPVEVASLAEIIQIETGEYHSIALQNDGTVWSWGWNAGGQLGNSTTIDSNVPIQVLSGN